jgi:glycosyltransferase involved in cell wall biosynthesis
MAAGSLRVPHVWHVRDNLSRDSFDRVYLAMLRTALRRQQPELVVANSEWTKSQLPLSMRETASVIPSPSGCPSPDLPVVDRWPITTLAVIGRISDRKGQHVAIEALSRLDVTSPVQLRIVGDALFGETAYKEKLERMAGGLPRHKSVRFVGHTDDVWSEFARADVVIVPSVVPEPFGQVVVQAMATGRVVVGSNAGGPAEVITHDVDGLLFVPGSADGLAGCLSAVMRDLELRNRLRDEARRTASRYSSAHLSGRLARFLEAAAAMTR